MKKRIYLLLPLLAILTLACNENNSIVPVEKNIHQIIADHTIIDDFEKIPPKYIDEVKKMIVAFPGESHSEAYREGLLLLQSALPEFRSQILTVQESPRESLGIYHGNPVGESVWFTWHAYDSNTRPDEATIIKNLISDLDNKGLTISAIGFAWCWDLFARRSRIDLSLERLTGKVSWKRDPEYGVFWYGASIGGPDGNREWGLNSSHYESTGNRVSLATYLEATVEYEDYCRSNNLATRIIYTTGPADFFTGESGYQGYLKHQMIKKFVYQDSSRILFDYNDILCHDNDGKMTTTSWKGNVYPIITPANLGDGSVGHISPDGALRLAKAQWWMLARIAGWDGN
jgi:hypothetical protein